MSSGTVGIEYARLVREDCARNVGSRVSFHAVDIRDLANTVIEQFEQIDKVREVRSIINRLITYSGEVISTDSTTLAKSIVNKLNDALGDTDD